MAPGSIESGQLQRRMPPPRSRQAATHSKGAAIFQGRHYSWFGLIVRPCWHSFRPRYGHDQSFSGFLETDFFPRLDLPLAATLPQVFFPSVAAVDKNTGHYVAFGSQAVLPEVRVNSTLSHPLRSSKISKVNFPRTIYICNWSTKTFSSTYIVHAGHGWSCWTHSYSFQPTEHRTVFLCNPGRKSWCQIVVD